MNILVTGAAGQLGRHVALAAAHSQDHYLLTDVAPGYEPLDITDPTAIEAYVDRNNIEAIVNCAAYTNVDAAETDPLRARELNAAAPRLLAEAMERKGGLLVHISTDYVFGQEPYNTPCREDQQGTPTGVYGATKKEGEEAIRRTRCAHLILRTAWLYSEYGRNFALTMRRLTAEKPELKVVFDQAGTPTYARDLAQAIVGIIEQRAWHGREGTYHYSNEGVCSWYDFAVAVAQLSGNLDCRISPCRSSEFPSPVTRPAYSVLDKTKIKRAFGLTIPHWLASLQACLTNIEQQ